MHIRERLMTCGPKSFTGPRKFFSSTQSRQAVNLQPLVSLLNRLLNGLRGGRCSTVDMDELREQILDAGIPGEIRENALHHVRNAVRYIRLGETGAARWELSTVRQALRVHLAGPVRLETTFNRG
jgi:hypothetical protein